MRAVYGSPAGLTLQFRCCTDGRRRRSLAINFKPDMAEMMLSANERTTNEHRDSSSTNAQCDTSRLTWTCGTDLMPILSHSWRLLSKQTSAKVTSCCPSMPRPPNSAAVCLNLPSIAFEASQRVAWNFTTTRESGLADARSWFNSGSFFIVFGAGGGEAGRNCPLIQTHCNMVENTECNTVAGGICGRVEVGEA